MAAEKKVKPVKLLVIGSGPAGFSAAIYAARAQIETVMLTGPTIGGQISLTAEIENFPGIPESMSGIDLVARFSQQAEKFGVEIEYDTATRIDLSKRPFKVETEGKIYHADNLILATGSKATLMNVPGEKEFIGSGVSYCATCDGFFFKGKNVAVVGGGNSAVEEAIFLTKFVNKVTVIHRRDQLRADPMAQKHAMENPKIDFLWDSVVTKVNGSDHVESLTVKNVKTGQERDVPFDGVFVFIGHKPVSDLFADQLEMKEGLVVVDDRMRTSVPGVYAAGESVDGFYRQVIVSAGSGAKAAISLTKDLEAAACEASSQ